MIESRLASMIFHGLSLVGNEEIARGQPLDVDRIPEGRLPGREIIDENAVLLATSFPLLEDHFRPEVRQASRRRRNPPRSRERSRRFPSCRTSWAAFEGGNPEGVERLYASRKEGCRRAWSMCPSSLRSLECLSSEQIMNRGMPRLRVMAGRRWAQVPGGRAFPQHYVHALRKLFDPPPSGVVHS